MLRGLLIAMALLMLCGCASLPPGNPTSTCERDGRTLRIVGPTDAKLVTCLGSAEAGDTVQITSPGGSVRNAIEAGRRLRTSGAALVVVEYCESSCANYLLPAASQVRIAAGARVVLHGSVDAWALERGAATDLYGLQRDYAAEMNTPPGWLLMRTGEDARSGRHGRYVTADGAANASRYIVVEPPFLASCLPALTARWDAPLYSSEIRQSGERLRRFEAQGYVFSGAMRCAADQSYPQE